VAAIFEAVCLSVCDPAFWPLCLQTNPQSPPTHPPHPTPPRPPRYTPTPKSQPQRSGDHQLRSNYSLKMQQLMRERGVDPASIHSIVDLGCATGLSSLALLEAFPAACLTGVDLSPYFLAVGRYEQREREVRAAVWMGVRGEWSDRRWVWLCFWLHAADCTHSSSNFTTTHSPTPTHHQQQ